MMTGYSISVGETTPGDFGFRTLEFNIGLPPHRFSVKFVSNSTCWTGGVIGRFSGRQILGGSKHTGRERERESELRERERGGSENVKSCKTQYQSTLPSYFTCER